MAFKHAIKELRLNNRLSKVEMAKKLNVSEGTIRMWENGNNEPRMGAIENIANTFNVTKSYLLGINEDITNHQVNTEEIDVDYYGKVSAGNFEEVSVEDGTLKVPKGIFKGRNPEECIGLEINGDSMNKILSNGSYIIVHDYRKSCNYTLNSNDILVLRVGGQYTVKRVRRTETKIHLDPDSYSDEFKTNTFDLENVDQIEVIGKVIYNYRSFD